MVTRYAGPAARTSMGRILRPWLLAIGVAIAAGGCGDSGGAELSQRDRAAIADSLQRLIVRAYDLSAPDVERRLVSLYPERGRVVSAAGGQVSTSRDSLAASLHAFWTNVGSRMREPKWTWGPMHVDVLSPDAAVLTTTYIVPHRTPAGAPHVIGGAWTAVFARRDGRWVIVQEHLSDTPAQLLQPAPHAGH